MDKRRDTIQATVQVRRVLGKKELELVRWKVDVAGVVTHYRNHGDMIVAADSIRMESPRLPPGMGHLMWKIADKAVKLAKLPKSTFQKMKDSPFQDHEPWRTGVAYRELEVMPVTITVVADMDGKILSKTQG